MPRKNMGEGWEKEFDEIIGPIPDRAIMQHYGKEFCLMCGHPTANDSTVKKIKDFIRSTILKAKEEEKERMKKWILEKRHSNESFNKMSTGNDIWEATGFNIALSDMLAFLYDRK